MKMEQMRANNEFYVSLGLPEIVSSFKAATTSNTKSKAKKGKEKVAEECDSQYIPENEEEVESDDSDEVHYSINF